ncbi:MAG: TonB-dependent receptor [Flavobacteriales bacterium CG_4_10_14_0_2_um_filter_32_8]|nr:MAG: TonB-dependent receptor [Flavobacteriales bacterium CG_4_10_14_0_2_um_filter_32_8]PJB15951.1 MAG: TonB-dependent receptor [Flavobacteriales bacterium CG_4_9_14_3_um_filter_32_8]
MKNSLLHILFFLLFINSFAQKNALSVNLFGQILDDKNEGLPYVAIGVFNTKDSSYVKGSATEMNGRFSIPLPPGNYYAQISFLSFETKVINSIEITNKDVDLKKIKLVTSVKNLDEFNVVEDKNLMELDLDKRIYNVDKDVTNQGADATEILDKVPSIDVDIEGNVSLRGSGNVRILINGKPSGMTGISTSEALKQLQGSQIEKIEVITNPSSRYDAEGEVGIINIILKRDKREGINGAIDANFGYPNNFGGGFNITLKRKNFSVFTGYGISYRETPGNIKLHQQFTYPDTSFSYKSNSKTVGINLSNNFRLGTEVFINQYNSFTVSGNYSLGDGTNETNLTYSDFNNLDVATQTVDRQELEDKEESSHDVSLNYRKTFKQKDRLLTFDVQQSESVDNEHSTISQNNDYIVSDNLEQKAFNNESSKNWQFQTDYVHPVLKGKLEFGLKSTLKEIEDDYQVDQLNDTISTWEVMPGFKNKLIYNDKVSAAYIMFGNKIKNFSYQLGVRTEYSDIQTNLTAANEINKNEYLDFFPSAHFTYELKKENSLQVSYSRRIQRPRHFYLLPFFSFSDSRNTFSGNPNLTPEYTDSYEVGYLKNGKKGSLLSNVFYRYTTDFTTWITTSDSQGITKRNPVNLGIKEALGVEFSGSYEIITWWNLRGSFNFYREIIAGEFAGIQYDSDDYAWSTKLNSKWSIKKKVNLQASFNYKAPQKIAQGETKAFYSLDAGFSFDLLKGNGTLSFNATDILNSKKRRWVAEGENFVSESEFQRHRSQNFRVSFTYRINQKKKNKPERDFENFDGGGEGG